ncbi:methyl-accepting chemotaxis protein [Paenibacillus taihuensis]|uniref:Methyl-accepting chemotaxis protein n=1 Tax=Paenibacillus taihuensis TaxID=1156355 RepID=A0A3D9SLR2_9BACL|nr:methyl-accepting chemotaxis protein [Paenibacillus taihuensis]REE91539.1 methyl-accepting chemotaxis protein [Paenibacillus taihuensis]
MEELSSGIQKVAESCTNAWDVSQQTSNKAEHGNEVIQQAVSEMAEVNQVVLETVEVVEKLSQRTSEIGRIITIIQEISNQTNLLSLNAAIEAARAGEHGRGFSVVSQEIRKLAEHSRTSADEIHSLIKEILDLTGMAVRSMQAGSETVHKGTTYVNLAGENFVSILNDIQSMVVQIQDISSSTEQMSAGSEEVTATVEQFSSIAEEASGNSQNVAAASQQQQASMIEIAASAQQLSETMQELQQLTSQFKVS